MLNCPKCKADTRVVNSRPVEGDGGVIKRRRACQGCKHRFYTFESTLNPTRHRASAAARAKRKYAKMSPEVRAEKLQLRRLRHQAKCHAAETGTPYADVLRAWSIPAPTRPSYASRS